jgi:hypothetical protein
MDEGTLCIDPVCIDINVCILVEGIFLALVDLFDLDNAGTAGSPCAGGALDVEVERRGELDRRWTGHGL